MNVLLLHAQEANLKATIDVPLSLVVRVGVCLCRRVSVRCVSACVYVGTCRVHLCRCRYLPVALLVCVCVCVAALFSIFPLSFGLLCFTGNRCHKKKPILDDYFVCSNERFEIVHYC